jgi:anti-sigma factor RsiW
VNCEHVSALLPELLGGALEERDESAALIHLAACPRCREELALWAGVKAAAEDGAPEMPAPVRRQAETALRKAINTSPAAEAADALRDALSLTRKAVRLALVCARIPAVTEGACVP